MEFRQPFKGDYPITQAYGVIVTGVTYKNRPHSGIDYACPEGTEILASADGTVKYSEFDNSGFGKVVIIQHENGNATLYAHLSGRFVKTEQQVKQGEVIGLSGNTGNSTGPHLHFEARHVWYDWKSHFDPMLLPLKSFADPEPAEPELAVPVFEKLKGAEDFVPGDLLRVQNKLGVKGFFSGTFEEYTTYLQGTPFFYTGDHLVRKDNGLMYLRVAPAAFTVWVAANDGETQLLDK